MLGPRRNEAGAPATAENASVAEVAKATEGAVKMEPGKWRTSVKFVAVDMPGMPKQAADMMGQQMQKSGNSVIETCVTPEMANQPPGKMLGAQDDGSCKYDSFSLAGGRLDAKMTCKPKAAGGPGELKMAMAGTFGGSAYDLTTETVMNGVADASPNGTMTVKTQISGKRLGDCDAPKAG